MFWCYFLVLQNLKVAETINYFKENCLFDYSVRNELVSKKKKNLNLMLA